MPVLRWRGARRIVEKLTFAIVWGSISLASAQPPAPATASAGALATAKDLFKKGVTLLDAGDVERALDYFLESRKAYPSSKNTGNAALCLDRLGRYDEALEMYEALLLEFGGDLDADDRATIGPAMAALRAKVGGLSLSSNVDGQVVVDGRARGKLPLTAPIRLARGKHVVRVIKDGYVPFERSIVVEVGATVPLDVELAPLAGMGLLRVEDPRNVGSDVFVDRANVGVSPWEGTVAAGRHVVWTQRGESSASPIAAIVIEGQVALVRLSSVPAGAVVRIEADPPTALVSLDGVALGTGVWQLRLAQGAHTASANEEGYVTRTVSFDVSPPAAPEQAVRVRLAVDPNHPRWPRRRVGSFFLDAWGGAALASSLRASADLACPSSCQDRSVPAGGVVAIRAGFRFDLGAAVEVAGGYWSVAETVAREFTTTYSSMLSGKAFQATYAFRDYLLVRAPFVGAGASYLLRLGPKHARAVFGLVDRLTVGALFVSARDPLLGTVTVQSNSAPLVQPSRNNFVSTVAPFVMPEIGAQVTVGPLHVGLAIAAAFVPVAGPGFDQGEVGVSPNCPPASGGGAPGCVPNSNALANDRAYGPVVVWLPTASLGYAF
jgi:hypothetical protein